MKKGIYIVFEGIVGSGKTTQSKMLVERLQRELPKREVVWTREPGGSEIAGAIRKIVQATEFEEEMQAVCEAYLYAAARAQSLRAIVRPVIKRGGIVVADRSYLTSVAFQGSGRGMGNELVFKINEVAIDGTNPNLVFFINVDPATSLKRTRDIKGDKFEAMQVDFFKKALKGYDFAAKKLKKSWRKIDGSKEIEQVHEQIYKEVLKLV